MLAAAQIQLEQQFATLTDLRKPIGYPVYALEHGLDPDAIAALAPAASTDLRVFGARDKYWLVWIVLSAEAGYRYAGEEFWPELEVAPGEWRNNTNRTWLRRQYERFADRFGGPTPVGIWAEQFSNIAWPIANAILPRYLQAHFAEHLFASRYALADLAASDAHRIGALLSDQYQGSSSRFADFLQQTELTTQIVLALRDEDLGGAAPRITPAMLQRMVGDLEQRRQSREYLRAARKVISTHRASVGANLHGGASGTAASSPSDSVVAGPRLAARRFGDRNLLIGLIFPDVAAAFTKAGLPQSALASGQIRLAGIEATPEPALALLTFARRDRELRAFPATDRPFALTESLDQRARTIVEPLLRLQERSCWVLRRHADGLYREVLGGHVRPGQSYIVLRRAAWADGETRAAGLEPLAAPTSGIVAYALDLAAPLKEAQRGALAALTIGTVAGTRIEAVGLAPSWDAPGELPAWCASETVTLRIEADFDAAGFRVQLDDGSPQLLPATSGTLLLAFDPPALGAHRLSVQALRRANDLGSAVGEVVPFDFAVAAPRSWIETMRDKAGFRLLVDPAGASLEHLFAGRATLRLFGPAGRAALWSIETFDAAGHLAASIPGGKTTVGDAPEMIATTLDRLRQAGSGAIDVAHRVDIVASLDELGRQSLAFPHRVDPLRWHYDPACARVRLIDESAHNAPVKVRTYSLSNPAEVRAADYDQAIAGIEIACPGALMVAIAAGRRYAMFVSNPATTLKNLADLGVTQSLEIAKPDLDAALILLSALLRWQGARPVGPQAVVRKVMTLVRIEDELAVRLCGRDFTNALRLTEPTPLVRAQSLVGGSPGFGLRMRTFPVLETAAEARTLFAEIAGRYAIEQHSARCDMAYALAFDPVALRLGSADAARKEIADLVVNRPLLRGAYLARAATRASGQAALRVAS
jgi:hypothetical protein